MPRRASGWTIVKQVAREIDRTNRANQRARVAHEKALLREEEHAHRESLREMNAIAKKEERAHRESLREMNTIAKKAERLQEQFNKSIKAANAAANFPTKEAKLREATDKLDDLNNLFLQYNFLEFYNLDQVEEDICRVQSDLDELECKQEMEKSLEQSAIEETEEELRAREEMPNILIHTLSVNDAVDWEELKDTAKFSVPEPIIPPQPMMPPKPTLEEIPEPPNSGEPKYKPQISLFSRFSRQKKQAIINTSKQLYETDFEDWQIKSDALQAENKRKLQHWEQEKQSLLTDWHESYQFKHEDWERQREEFIKSQDQYNASLSTLKQEYEAKEKASLEEYCSLVLSRSEYPFDFSKDYRLEYFPDSQVLAADYGMPTIDVIPTLKESKFIKSKGEIRRTYITDKQCQEIYDTLLYSMTLRTIHELFEADTVDAIKSIILNGWVTSLDKATGNESSRCILSINVTKQEFLSINLANIDPRECFKRLKGVGSAKLSTLVPVAPILNLDKEDRRFMQSYDVTGNIQEGDNLAVMHWEDFEHLIRELFEKEFGVDGSEVKVTQASRDGGVDAVIFDPDPIRGGKIVVQAKRYTNTVGVAAVRDLYGTIINEGAMKGILITTSNYGSDAFHFAKDKPITLMSGANLLHLLEKHGNKARIDLREAKRA